MKVSTLRKLVLSFVSSWLALVAYTDFIVVPTVFTTVSRRVEAGELGMKVFAALGTFEVIISIFLFFSAIVVFKKFRTKRSCMLFIFATSLCGFALLGKFYMTPKITKLNSMKYTLDETTQQYKEVDKEHQLYHSLYIKLDGAKILFLIAGLLGSLRSSRFDHDVLFKMTKHRAHPINHGSKR